MAKQTDWLAVDKPGRFREISKHSIHIEERYQRPENIAHARRLAKNWSWRGCGTIALSRRDGKYWVFDGQHRVLAARMLGFITTLPCMVFDHITIEEEARAFIRSNTDVGHLSTIDKLRARVCAGDEVAVRIMKVITDLGLILTKCPKSEGHIGCVAAVAEIATRDPDGLFPVLSLAQQCSIGVPVWGEIVKGLGWIHRNSTVNCNDEKFRRQVCTLGASALRVRISMERRGVSGEATRLNGIAIMQVLNEKFRQKYQQREAA